MSETSPLPRILRFGAYQCDPIAGELHKNGIKVKLSDQPFRLLTLLLERPGEVITRKELGERLWPAGTFVDFEDGLNTAVRKLRAALDDEAENPRFLETIPKRGYRFVAPVSATSADGRGGLTSYDNEAIPAVQAASPSARSQTRPGRRLLLLVASAALAGGLFVTWWSTPLPPPRVTRTDQITSSARIDTPVKPVSDGSHVYYIERRGGQWDLMESPVRGGEEQPLQFPGRSAAVMDVSLRDSKLLIGAFASRNVTPQLWFMPMGGGTALRVGDISAPTAAFSPDGAKIAYASDGALWMADANGEHGKKIATIPEDAGWLAWSPDGQRLRFTEGSLFSGSPTSLWEISRDGKNLQPILPGWTQPASQCCGAWTRDGRYYVFTSYHGRQSNLWALREKGSWWRRSPRGPFQLTFGPDSPWGGTPDQSGRRIFFYNGVWHETLELLDLKTKQLAPFSAAAETAMHISYSRDGNWMVYADAQNHELFRSRPDGTERIELAPAELNAAFPRWSPDGKWIVFGGKLSGQDGTDYVVPATGGQPEPLLPGVRLSDADWSVDQSTLVASQLSKGADSTAQGVLLIDFKTRRATGIPDSAHLAMTRWSFDGRYISATTEDQTQLKLWDVARRKWTVIAHGTALGISVWSPDSRYLYFQDLLAEGEPLWRYDVRTRRAESVADFSAAMRGDVDRCALDGMTPDGAPLMGLNRGALDLFAARVAWP